MNRALFAFQSVFWHGLGLMSKIKANLKYTKEHEWLKIEGEVATVGITDYAQEQLGDVVFIEMPDEDSEVEAESTISTIESVKAVSDIYAPITGTISVVNDSLKDEPAKVNSDPYGEGWLFKIKISDANQVDSLMSDSEYEEFLKTL